MRSLNLDQLRTLVAIADLGTFAAAAQALHLAPPTVSLHISELEGRLGTPLLLRGGRKVLATAAGAALVERGRQLLRDSEDAIDLVQRHAQGRVGKVRLGTSTGVVVHLLPRVLEALARAHPGIDVEVSVLGSSDTLQRLAARQLEIGIVTLPQPGTTELSVTPWRSDPMMAFLPLAWEAPEAVTPAWLAERPLVFNDSGTRMFRLTMEWFGLAGFSPTARIELNYTEAMKSLVAAGYGAALLPVEQPPEEALQIATQQRLQLRPLQPPLQRELGLVHPDPVLLPAAALHVLETLRAFAG
ncbi:MAG: LysR family transcriptional regulator [Burkholderiaceae bacterium]|nr:LysR family transcriptional regulator [Burkholderiaceae bacterium]